jgi:hypothetical protein
MTLEEEFIDLIRHVGWYADEKFDWVDSDEDLKSLTEADLRRYNLNRDLLQESIRLFAASLGPKGVTEEAVNRLKEIVNTQLTHPDFKE